ncbi:MAG: hypothetical protein IJL71_01430 [Oscillospiraceae bacterium]|nr:hypothetical protein [Oscillospiraceae bacterium]
MKKNRFLSLLLALVMLFGAVSALGATASAEMKLETPYGWFGPNHTIKWKLVPGILSSSSPNSYKVKYHVRGYYSIDGALGITEAFSFWVEILTFLSDGESYATSGQDMTFHLDLSEKGYASIDALDYICFYPVYNQTIDKEKLHLTFYINAAQELSSTIVESDDYISETITGSELQQGLGILPPGFVTLSPRSPRLGSSLTYSLSGELANLNTNWAIPYWERSSNGVDGWEIIRQNSPGVHIVDYDDLDQYIRLVFRSQFYADEIVSTAKHIDKETLSGEVYISPASPKAGETLTAYLSGTAFAIPNAKLHYQWRYSTGNTRYINIEGATGKTYTVPSSTPAGYKYEVVVTADGHDGSLISEPVTVAAAPALSGTVRISPTSPKAGETLTISLSGTVGSIPSSKLHYQWRSAASNARFSSISGATNSTYTVPTSTSAGYRYEVYVTADGYEGTLVSNTATVVEGTPTLSGKATVSPANPKVGDTLRITLSGGLENISARNIKYQWQYTTGNSRYSGIRTATGSTYKIPDSAQPGYKYRVAITADGYTGTIYSDPVTVTAASSYPKGDVDRSGQVGNSDLIMVARHVVHIITLTGEQFTLGDMDNDNVIDNKDIISVARKVVGL